MKKIVLLLFISNLLSAQEININYKFYKNVSFEPASETKNFMLHQNSDFSIFELENIKDINNFKHPENISIFKEKDTMNIYTVNDTGFLFLFEEKVFKDFKNDTQINNFLIGTKSKYIKDKINLFNWQILNVKDTLIADYLCKKAVTNFRGRNYTAYFTNEIANQGGPWKFDGLPGMILTVKSDDGYLLIEPKKISINQKNVNNFTNPFIGKIVIEFDQLAEKFIEEEKKQVARVRSQINAPEKSSYGIPEGIENIGINKIRVYE